MQLKIDYSKPALHVLGLGCYWWRRTVNCGDVETTAVSWFVLVRGPEPIKTNSNHPKPT